MNSHNFSIQEFNNLPAVCRATIIENTIAYANNNEIKQPHSIQSIVDDNRHLAIASRMIRKPVEFTQCKLNPNGEKELGANRAYLGSEIADIFVNSVKKNGFSYFPLSGTWKTTGVKQLVLFVKDGIYKPYARFKIDVIIDSEDMSVEQLKTLTDITPVYNSKYKSILKISNVEIDNIPKNYIGIRSGVDLYECAFKGSAPNLLMI